MNEQHVNVKTESKSHDLLILLGFGVVALGIVAIAYFAFLSSQSKISTPLGSSYVMIPQGLKS